MASTNSTRASAQVTSRLRIAAGFKRGAGPLTITTADRHAAAAAHARAAIALLDDAAAQAHAAGDHAEAAACTALADGARAELGRRAA